MLNDHARWISQANWNYSWMLPQVTSRFLINVVGSYVTNRQLQFEIRHVENSIAASFLVEIDSEIM